MDGSGANENVNFVYLGYLSHVIFFTHTWKISSVFSYYSAELDHSCGLSWQARHSAAALGNDLRDAETSFPTPTPAPPTALNIYDNTGPNIRTAGRAVYVPSLQNKNERLRSGLTTANYIDIMFI
jgi:hypothetical protein